MTAIYTPDEILSQLDQAAKKHRFLMLDNGYYYPVEQRLHAYRDPSRWAIIIEALGYNPRAGNLLDVLEKHGNCVSSSSADNDDFIPRIDNHRELWDLEQAGRPWTDAGHLVVRGVSIPLLRGDGAADHLEPWSVIRAIEPDHRDLFLASEDELRQRVPPDLPPVLKLDVWHHPDVVTGELPSGSEAFRLIADVLVTGDPSRYTPTQTPNTHWSNWPDGGTL